MNNHSAAWLLPLALLICITILSGYIDIPIENLFYDPQTRFISNSYTDFIAGSCGQRTWGPCDWGVFPAQVAGVASVAVFLLSYVRKSWKAWRKPALMLILTMAIGAGFITHTLLKDNWGRPRPKQTVEFGGSQPFRAIYQPNFFHQPEPSKSFPCGHCTMGFFFFALYFLGRRTGSPMLSYMGLALALTLGVTLALVRMMQGGHFFSDTVVAGIIMWLTALACDWLLFSEEA